jgi:hypothetical protein
MESKGDSILLGYPDTWAVLVVTYLQVEEEYDV